MQQAVHGVEVEVGAERQQGEERHVAALRSGGSFESMQPGDVDSALTAERPSELLIKGVVAGAVSEAESRLEERLANNRQRQGKKKDAPTTKKKTSKALKKANGIVKRMMMMMDFG